MTRPRHILSSCLADIIPIILGIFIGVTLEPILTLSPAAAQMASQIVEKTYRPDIRQEAGKGVILPEGGGQEAPQGAETLHVTLSGLDVRGGMPELQAETERLEAQLKGKSISGADLFAAANALETAYIRAGYILVRVSLPPQSIRNGQRLKLVVTRGFVEAIDASGLSTRVRHHVERYLSFLVGRNDLTRQELERQLLLAGDTPGLMLKSVLKAGKASGSTVIIVEGYHAAMTGSLDLDNSLSPEMGRWNGGLGVALNSIFGKGEVIYGRIAGYPDISHGSLFDDDPCNRLLVFGFSVPLGTKGYWFAMEGTDSRTHPTSTLGYTLPDHFQRLSTKAGYHWLRSRKANMSTTLTFDISEEKQEIDFDGSRSDFTHDSLRVVRLTQSGDRALFEGAHISASATLSVGLDMLGARKGTFTVPLSRDGAKPDFTKLAIEARFTQAFGHKFGQMSLSAQAQTSFGTALVCSEQIGIGGSQWLSAFQNGNISGDSGVAARAEWSLPTRLPLFPSKSRFGAAIVPYVFAAGGIVTLEQPSAVEHDVTRATSFGAGIRIGMSEAGRYRSGSLSLEYAHGTTSHSISEDRINFALHATF